MIKKYFFFISMLFIFGSCSKEKDLSQQIAGKWKINEMIIDNIDVLYPMQDFSFYNIEMDYHKGGDFAINAHIDIENYSYFHRFTGKWQVIDKQLILEYRDNEIGCLIGVFMPANTVEKYEIANITNLDLSLTSINQNKIVLIDAKAK